MFGDAGEDGRDGYNGVQGFPGWPGPRGTKGQRGGLGEQGFPGKEKKTIAVKMAQCFLVKACLAGLASLEWRASKESKVITADCLALRTHSLETLALRECPASQASKE